jgi:Protein of unknown function (DUF3237)
MKLEPLYRLRFDYPESWRVELKGDAGTEEQHFLSAVGTAEGRLTGRFRGTNFARRRTDRTFLTDFKAVIETTDGATVLLTCQGFGRASTPQYARISPGIRQWVAVITHVSDHERYRWLNDAVCVGTGQVKAKPVENPSNPTELMLDVAELIWEPLTQ